MEPQILRFYALAREAGVTEFMAAVELAAEQQAIGVDYVRALLHAPQRRQASTDAGGKPSDGVAGSATAGNGGTSVESL